MTSSKFIELERATVTNEENTEPSKATVTISAKLPQDLKYFEGHFPNFKILPGFVQVAWAENEIKSSFRQFFAGATTVNFKEIRSLKFLSALLPENSFELRLDFKPSKPSVVFSYRDGARQFSSGEFILEVL